MNLELTWIHTDFFAIQETVAFKVPIRYKKTSTEMEEACLMGFSGGFE